MQHYLKPKILFKCSGSFDKGICLDLFSKQFEDGSQKYPIREEVYQKKDKIRKTLTVGYREKYADFLSSKTGLQWHSEYINIIVAGHISHFVSHYSPIIITVGHTDDIGLLSAMSLYEVARYFIFENQKHLTQFLTHVNGYSMEDAVSSISFELVKEFIENTPFDGYTGKELEIVSSLYGIKPIEQEGFMHFLNLIELNKETSFEYPSYPLVRFGYSKTYDVIYNEIYKYNSKIYNYKNPYPGVETIFKELKEPYSFVKNNLSEFLDIVVTMLGDRLVIPKGYIDFYFIGNTKLFSGLAYPPTICSRIQDKGSIPVTIFHELLHIIYWFNNAKYRMAERFMSEYLELKESHSITHILIYPILDEICKKWPELSKYEGSWKTIPVYKELASAVERLGHDDIIKKILYIKKGWSHLLEQSDQLTKPHDD